MLYITALWDSFGLMLLISLLKILLLCPLETSLVPFGPRPLKMASSQKKGYLIYQGTSILPMPTDQDVASQ